MAAIDKLMQYMYFQDRLDARKEAREEKSLTRALSEFTKEANYKVTTAGELEDLADEQTDINVLNELMTEVDNLKTGVKYVDDLVDTSKQQIGVRIGALESYNAIDTNIDEMLAKINVGDKKATEGFLSTMQDYQKNVAGITDNLTQQQETLIKEEFDRAYTNFEFIQRMGAIDTDLSTPEIDYKVTGQREFTDPNTGEKKMFPTYSHTPYERGYIKDVIQPEIDAARGIPGSTEGTGEYGFVNKLLALMPGNIRAEQMKLGTAQVKADMAAEADRIEDAQYSAYSSTMAHLKEAQGGLDTLFKKFGRSSTDMESLLANTSTNLANWGGMSKESISNLPVPAAVKSIENDINLLVHMMTDLGPLDLIKGDYNPLEPDKVQDFNQFVATHLWDKDKGFKEGKGFAKATKDEQGAVFRTILKSYLLAREELIGAVGLGTWYHPEYLAPGDSQDPIPNPYGN